MTKDQLKAYRDIKLEHDRLLETVKAHGLIEYDLQAVKLDGMPRGSSTPGSIVEAAAIKHADLMASYRRKIGELAAALAAIEKAIETLAPRERTLVRLHYAEGLTWEEVCVAMSYSWRQVHRIHAAALEKLKEV